MGGLKFEIVPTVALRHEQSPSPCKADNLDEEMM
jgi:hypothetical protein